MTTTEVREPLTYEKNNGHSYFFDRVASANGNEQSSERLRRHAIDVRISPEIRALSKEDRYGDSDGVKVPPLYVLEKFRDQKRSGYLGLISTEELPPGADAIHGEEVGGGPSSYRAEVVTIEGRQGITHKALSGPVGFDDILVQDLVAAYLTNVGLQIINGSGIREYLGIRNISSLTRMRTLAAGDSAYTKVADAIQRFYVARISDPEMVVAHPRLKAAWMAAHGVGTLHGLPIEADSLLPAATKLEDVVHVVRPSDFRRWESAVRIDLDQEGEVAKFKLYAQSAFTAERHLSSVVELTGPVVEYLPL